MRFVLQHRLRAICDEDSHLVIAKAKSITLAFDRHISEAGFGELMVLLDFRFGKGSHFMVVSFLLSLVAPCFLRLPLFSSDDFFLSPLHF
jgi:hypothetical protein